MVRELESTVADFDARAYVRQSSAAEIPLLSSFRQDMSDAITRFRECVEFRDLKRIPCLAQWWRSVVAIEQRYAQLETAALSKSDARLVQLLKQILSIESYIPGTNPIVARHLPVDAPPTTLRELIDDIDVQSAAEAKERPIEKLKDTVSKLKAFVRNIGQFSRVQKRDDDEQPSVKRRLLSDADTDAHPDVLAEYHVDLDAVVDTLETLLSRRTESSDASAEHLSADALHFSSGFKEKEKYADEAPTPVAAFREELLQAIGRRVVGVDKSQTVTKVQNRLEEWIQDVLSERKRKLLADAGAMSPADVPDIQRIFREKASASTKRLGEWKATMTRKRARTRATSIEDLPQPVREQLRSLIDSLETDGNGDWLRFREQFDTIDIENPSTKAAVDLVRQTLGGTEEHAANGDNGEDMKATIAKLDASLREHLGNGWSRIVEDGEEEMRRILKASTAIVAHDAHFHSTMDHGLPNELLKLDHLPTGSDEILSEVHLRQRRHRMSVCPPTM